MNLKQTRLHILHKPKDLSGQAKTGVSLHCHTEHSKEMLDFVPHYADKLPIISYFWNKERTKYQKREGKFPDFSTGFWSPPLTAQAVYNLERKQINQIGLDAVASLTDHDSIDANLQINETTPNEQAPISLEWTVPFEYGFFHVGVHNLPKRRAAELTETLLDYTFNKENHTPEKLNEMFSMLGAFPEVLVVLNHPLWDIEMVGKERHKTLLKNFIRRHGRWIHAFEVNGFRSWSENKAVIEMAEALGIPLVTGGDRHGCKPNTVLNLTNAKTFSEFAEEIRAGRRSEIVLMPEYSQPLHSRQLQSFAEILKLYPDFPDGRRKWFDRVHFDIGDGYGLRPLSVHWEFGGPAWLRVAIKTLGILGHKTMRPAFWLARKKQDVVPKNLDKAKFTIPDLEELSANLTNQAAATSTDSLI
ncbi:MAG: glycerate kinase [Acidobacteriota bacterium]|nr:glycerate kinase [Acidobacteriota bacterium]